MTKNSKETDFQVNKDKVSRLVKKIAKEEALNAKTSKKNNDEMIRFIAKEIREEVKCL